MPLNLAASGPATSVSLAFDDTNWDQAQTVTVHGVDDALIDGDIAFTIATAPAISTDPDYTGLDPADVSATNLDDEVPAGVSVTAIAPNSMSAGTTVTVTISGSGFAAGASVTFENGSGKTPTATVTSVTGISIEADITVGNGGPPRPRVWDVRVTNPDSSTGVLAGGFTVVP